jgi:hypothetical protein
MKFKLGYYYKFIGDKNDYYWVKDMKKILDKKWHKCVEIKKDFFLYTENMEKKFTSYYVKFEGMKKEWLWVYEDFIESKHHPYVKKLLKEINGG